MRLLIKVSETDQMALARSRRNRDIFYQFITVSHILAIGNCPHQADESCRKKLTNFEFSFQDLKQKGVSARLNLLQDVTEIFKIVFWLLGNHVEPWTILCFQGLSYSTA